MGRVKSTFAQKMKLLELAKFHSKSVDDNEDVRVWDEGQDAESIAKEVDDRFTRQHMRYVLKEAGVTITGADAPVRNQYAAVNEKLDALRADLGKLQAAMGANYRDLSVRCDGIDNKIKNLGKDEIDDIKAEAGQLRAAWKELQDDIDTNKARRERLDDHARRITSLEKQVDADSGGRVGSKVKRLESRVTGLELQLGSKK